MSSVKRRGRVVGGADSSSQAVGTGPPLAPKLKLEASGTSAPNGASSDKLAHALTSRNTSLMPGASGPPLVVLSKLSPPLTQGGMIARAEVDVLMRRSRDARLTLISAPAGYGKTVTAATHFAEVRESDGAIGWVSLDPQDRDPSRFLSHLILALQTARSRIGVAAQSLLMMGSSVPTRGILQTLFNEIGTIDEPVCAVLDDFHRCESPEINALVDDLLDGAPSNFSLLITSRVVPQLHMLGRLRAQNRLAEVQADHLRMTLPEANAFCNEVLGLSLTREQLVALYERTDGWAAGLQLAALSLRNHPDRDRFVAEFSGSNHDFGEYLAEEVLANLPAGTRAFLLETSILERLSAPLCNAVTGRDDGTEMLAEMARANMFISPLDDEHTWYRYHHLFAEFLQRNLKSHRNDEVVELHRRAYNWYADNGMIGDAIGHALESGDWEKTVAFIESSWYEIIKMGRVRTLLDWIERLPAKLKDQHPRVRIAMCWALALRREGARAYEHFIAAREAIDSKGFAKKGLCERDHAALRAELQTTELLIHVFSDREEEMVAVAEATDDSTVEYDPFVQGVHDNLLIYAHFVAGDYDTARRCAARGRERHMRADGIYGAVYSDCLRGLMEVSAGELDSAAMLYERALRLATDRIGRTSVPAAMPAVLASEVYYLRNDLAQARSNLDEMLHMVDECSIADAVLVGHRTMARILSAEGRHSEALDALSDAEIIGRRSDLDRLVVAALAQRSRILVQMGDLKGAAKALAAAEKASGPYPTGVLARWSRRHIKLSQAKAALLIAQGKADAALEVLMPVLANAETAGRVLSHIELLVLDAAARSMAGSERGAIRQLRKALSISARTGMIRVYVDQGEQVGKLVQKAWADWSEGPGAPPYPAPREHLQEVLVALGCDIQPSNSESPDLEVDLELSQRERDVLRALFSGCSNKQIARHLSVADSTVAWHLKNIYAKLNVANRTEAVSAAMRHSLL